MKRKRLAKETWMLADRYRVNDGRGFLLSDFDPQDTNGIKDKDHAKEVLCHSTDVLCEMQDKLYAQDKWAVLVVLQGTDAAGKDGLVKHVMAGINPQGCDVYSFKQPSKEELSHEFMWRAHKNVPQRGKIGIFNRSYYEDVLVVRVHPELLQAESLPEQLVTENIWEQRFEDINHFERYLVRNGVVVLKVFLNLSKKEQKKRFLARLENSDKNWKFSMADIKERAFWNDYRAAYEDMIRRTATEHAPWYVVPADNKWFTRLAVAAAIIDAMRKLNLQYPTVDAERKKELRKIEESLLTEKDQD
jgi:PPK2 family polyphosphate:nucleotide phosphotransferase